MFPRIIHAACHWPQIDEKMDEDSHRSSSEAGHQVLKGVWKFSRVRHGFKWFRGNHLDDLVSFFGFQNCSWSQEDWGVTVRHGFAWSSDQWQWFGWFNFLRGLSIHLPKSETRTAKKIIRAKTRVPYPQLCNFGPYLFYLIESLMLHVFASICGMELTRQMSLSSKERKLTNRPREDWLGNHARTIRYQCGNVCFWPWLTPFWSILSSQVGLKMVKGWLSDCSCSLLPVTLCRERLHRNLPQKKS